jgi:hypothetical protein
MFACPSHSWNLAMSASWSRTFVAAVARSAWAPILSPRARTYRREFVDTVRGYRVVEFDGAVVADGSEEGAFGVGGVTGLLFTNA